MKYFQSLYVYSFRGYTGNILCGNYFRENYDYSPEMERISLKVLLLSIMLLCIPFAYSQGVEPGLDFDTAAPLDLSTGSASINGSLTKTFEDNHYYMLTGLKSGVQVSITGSLKGIEPGLTTVSLYSPTRARLIGVDQVIGKNIVKKIELRYLLAYDPANPGENKLYVRIGKSSGSLNYTLDISIEYFFDADSGRDAGATMKDAIQAPSISRDVVTTFRGYLAEKEYGNDYSDYYKLNIDLQPKDEIYIEVKPEPYLMVWASLLTPDGFSLRYNKSESKGEPLTLRVRGDWKTGVNTFYLAIENMGGAGGGGGYTVKVEIHPPKIEDTTATSFAQTQTSPWPFLGQENIRNIIIIISVAIVAIAIIVIIVRRRRRVIRVEEEWGGWSTGESWEEGWEETL
ncbi:MAG: hypothetical protein LZ172_07295 [Thaumarchaeota archaeon]|jgi:hypothetical protein|nr:hypothetical protein [Candidatus Geocrenenecus arthurdayi]MCL7404133.1 hypothetical protein [Candidatus Geocrenenecus arthurdayi]